MGEAVATVGELFTGDGRPLALGTELGRGGEGSVHALDARPELVAKVYHREPDAEKWAKLAAMVRLGSPRLLRLATWPVETLHREPGGAVVGFLMPRIGDHKAVHTLYSPRSRLVEFPRAGWPFLIHAATNTARAFAAIHEHGHVIGDVNHGNLVVSPEATVMLIDCDSFQIASAGRLFLCEVGVSTHTPPELQGRPFREVVRTANHDAFGLAVLIFQLLLMGRHPFSGAYTGGGEMPLERSISEYRFAYGPQAAQRLMRPPPGTPDLAILSPPVAALFERAFAPAGAAGRGRPAPRERVEALGDLAAALTRCERNSTHHYLSTLAACPWCAIEARVGIVLFGYMATVGEVAPGHFDLAATWAAIAAVRSPGAGPRLPAIVPATILPTRGIVAQRTTRRIWALGVGGLALGATLGVFVAGFPLLTALVIVACVVAGAALTLWNRFAPHQKTMQAQLHEVRRRYLRLRQQWEQDATAARFTAKLRALQLQREQYENLPTLRQQKLDRLAAERQERQRQRFLDTFPLEGAEIAGIGRARVATLQSFGIETAADVAGEAIRAVPGFGAALTGRLLEWRRSLEAQFVYNPGQAIDPRDIVRVEQEIVAERLRLELALRAGPAELRQLGERSLALRDALYPDLEESAYAVAQAEADWQALRRP